MVVLRVPHKVPLTLSHMHFNIVNQIVVRGTEDFTDEKKH